MLCTLTLTLTLPLPHLNPNAIGLAQTKPVPSDYWYSILDGGDWDGNGNGRPGEFGHVDAVQGSPGDFGPRGDAVTTPDWAVGRIPHYAATDVSILDGILRKTIAYESAALADIGWRRSGLVATVGEARIFFGEVRPWHWPLWSFPCRRPLRADYETRGERMHRNRYYSL